MRGFKILVVAAILIILAMASCHGDTLPSGFIETIHKVETNGRFGPIKGDRGRALGPLQIHHAYWQNSGVAGFYYQCENYAYSVQVVTAYLNKYANQYIASGNVEALARIHNGGPNGYAKVGTLKYWERYKICRTNAPPSFRARSTG